MLFALPSLLPESLEGEAMVDHLWGGDIMDLC